MDFIFYKELLLGIKERIRQGQQNAQHSANIQLLATYWDIGRMIHERQKEQGWGKGVIPKLAIDLKNELTDVRGFSERNIDLMLGFYKEYQDLIISQTLFAKLDKSLISLLPLAKSKQEIAKLPVSQFNNPENKTFLISMIGWSNHIVLIQKIKDQSSRFWYMQQTLINNWNYRDLVEMIKSNLHLRQGSAIHNFEKTLSPSQSELAKVLIKDPYIFDFMSLSVPYSEKELELELIKHIEKFLLELGAGFAFVGRQYKIEVSDRDFYIDLLFYHIKMHCYVVVELKKGDFIPEYAGKMNFYCSAVDDQLRHPDDKPTIGLILCQEKDSLFAEYALRDVNKPIGISDYELTRILPDDFKSSLPSIEEIEEALRTDRK